MVAYRTLAEYHALMQEAKAEFDAWEAQSKKGRFANKDKHKAIRLAKLEAKKAFADTLDIEVE